MSLSKIIPKRMCGLICTITNIMDKDRAECTVRIPNNIMTKNIKQNNYLNDNILVPLDIKIINQIKMPMVRYQNLSNQYNFKVELIYFQVSKHLINSNDIYLYTNLENVNYDDIPIVTYYSILEEALETDRNNIKNPFNIYKKICSIVDALNLGPAAMEDLKKDLKIVSRVFYQLFITVVKYKILDMVDDENSIRAIRNSSCHDNYFFMAGADGMNITHIENLKAVPFLDLQRKLNQLEIDDLVIYGMHKDHNGVKHIKFCYIIKIKDFWMVVNKFKDICEQIIVKSKQQPQNDEAKEFNNLKEIQLLRYIHQADKLFTYAF